MAAVKTWLLRGAALLYGVLAAFFLVLRTLFTDGPADALHPEYLLAYALNVVGIGAPVALLAWRVPVRGGWGFWIAAPGLAVCLLYRDAPVEVWVFTVLSVMAGAWIGEAAGRGQSRRRGET